MGIDIRCIELGGGLCIELGGDRHTVTSRVKFIVGSELVGSLGLRGSSSSSPSSASSVSGTGVYLL